MAYRCKLCGKGVQFGHRVSHSKRRTRRVFKPNLHLVRVLVEGQMKRVLLCTKCLRATKVVVPPTQEKEKEVKTPKVKAKNKLEIKPETKIVKEKSSLAQSPARNL